MSLRQLLTNGDPEWTPEMGHPGWQGSPSYPRVWTADPRGCLPKCPEK